MPKHGNACENSSTRRRPILKKSSAKNASKAGHRKPWRRSRKSFEQSSKHLFSHKRNHFFTKLKLPKPAQELSRQRTRSLESGTLADRAIVIIAWLGSSLVIMISPVTNPEERAGSKATAIAPAPLDQRKMFRSCNLGQQLRHNGLGRLVDRHANGIYWLFQCLQLTHQQTRRHEVACPRIHALLEHLWSPM